MSFCFSFPLHAPGKHDDLRDDELMSLELPTFIVRGTRDTFSSQDLFDSAMKTMRDAKKRTPSSTMSSVATTACRCRHPEEPTTDIELDGSNGGDKLLHLLKNINARQGASPKTRGQGRERNDEIDPQDLKSSRTGTHAPPPVTQPVEHACNMHLLCATNSFKQVRVVKIDIRQVHNYADGASSAAASSPPPPAAFFSALCL